MYYVLLSGTASPSEEWLALSLIIFPNSQREEGFVDRERSGTCIEKCPVGYIFPFSLSLMNVSSSRDFFFGLIATARTLYNEPILFSRLPLATLRLFLAALSVEFFPLLLCHFADFVLLDSS
jgi:hypothetical protein